MSRARIYRDDCYVAYMEEQCSIKQTVLQSEYSLAEVLLQIFFLYSSSRKVGSRFQTGFLFLTARHLENAIEFLYSGSSMNPT